ncbi:putative lipoprotein [Bacteriovorax sp. BSW11_IV]|uniref:hypothetical protein n=1 Tax=Bacteriovorax sp. BSW11_IV TaxID=1353529 RepID=UPI00038A4F71|nr:hypothetical protein [Bacteriovorax sp. BSW11_IV]EQC50089.1 putative lipoprotein [Bacteriovorax sp. BSW11_IV]
MKVLLFAALCTLAPNMAMAMSCKKGQNVISCSNVQGKQRESFCWKGQPKAQKLEKICKSQAKVKKNKKATKTKA